MSMLRITGGTVYDPANGVDGVVQDVCVQDGRIVASLPADAPRLNAAGMVIMPGGIDIHAHVAASSTTLATHEFNPSATSQCEITAILVDNLAKISAMSARKPDIQFARHER